MPSTTTNCRRTASLKLGILRRDAAGMEDHSAGGNPYLCHSSLALAFQTMLSPCNVSRGRGIWWFCACFGCTQAGAWAKAGMADTAEPVSCLSTAAVAVMAWVSRREMRLLKCLPSISGRGWHPATAAPPVQQLKGRSFLCEPETSSAKQGFWWHIRNPLFSKSMEIWLYEKASLLLHQKSEC